MNLSSILRLVNKDLGQKDKALLKDIITYYTYELRNELLLEDPEVVVNKLVSEYNFEERKQFMSSKPYNMTIEEGDIVYMDFGKAYLAEAGYQHFGLVIRIYDAKALVIPMTSNPEAYVNAYDKFSNPKGLRHLMRFGRQNGCHKYSVLFLNDAKFVNTARIINIKGHIGTQTFLFKKIRDRLIQIIQFDE